MESFPNKTRDFTPHLSTPLSELISLVGCQSIEGMGDIEERVKLILNETEEGFRVDVHILRNLKRNYEKALFSLQNQTHTKSGRVVNIDSTRELRDLLFRDFCLPPLRSTGSGKPSVAIGVLERLYDSGYDVYPILKSLIEFKNNRALIKPVKTIFKKLDLHGRIHPEFNSSTCPSGRIVHTTYS
jgi:DNA polymerase I-like protein with 3'-5' exonuclease and polymerase domains